MLKKDPGWIFTDSRLCSLPSPYSPICLIDLWCCRRNSLKADMMMMTMVSARSWSASPSPISAYRRGGVHGGMAVAAFLVPSFFLRIIRPSARERAGDTQMYSEEPEIMQHSWLLERSEAASHERASEDLAWPTNLSTANINRINLIRSSARLELLFHKRHGDV